MLFHSKTFIILHQYIFNENISNDKIAKTEINFKWYNTIPEQYESHIENVSRLSSHTSENSG